MARIIRLEASNIKRLKAVTITPKDGEPVIIGGRNGQGKSTTLDCIAYAFGGAKAIPSEPVRRGEERAEIVAETDEYTVRRWWTASGKTHVEVTTPDGAVIKSPQGILAKAVGPISFKPTEFMRSSPKDQAEIIREACGFDTAAVDEEIKSLFDQRTNINRDAKAARSRVDAMPHHRDAPAVGVSMDSVRAKLDEADANNATRDAAERGLGNAMAEEAAAADEYAKCEQALAAAFERGKAAAAAIIEAKAALNAAPARVDNAGAVAEFERAAQTNAKVTENVARTAAANAADAFDAEAASLSEQIEAKRGDRAALIAAASLPDGIEIDGDIVRFGGVPFGQAAKSEQIRATCAIAFAGDSSLRVALIEDGSLLDDDAMAALVAEADARGFQVWIERVGDGDPGAVIIEDGEVRDPA